MSAEKAGPTKIIIENADGTVSYVEGKDAVKWANTMRSLVQFDSAHDGQAGKVLGDLDWKEEENLDKLTKKT